MGSRGKRGHAMGAPRRSEEEGVLRVRAGSGRNPAPGNRRVPSGAGVGGAALGGVAAVGMGESGEGKNVALGSFIGKTNYHPPLHV